MNVEANIIRLLGAAQLIVSFASMFSERLLSSVVGSDNTSTKLVRISKDLTLMRVSNVVALVNSLAIVILAALFHTVFGEQYKIGALVALGCFLAEAITLALSKIGTYAHYP